MGAGLLELFMQFVLAENANPKHYKIKPYLDLPNTRSKNVLPTDLCRGKATILGALEVLSL